jgi:hypothetical protein
LIQNRDYTILHHTCKGANLTKPQDEQEPQKHALNRRKTQKKFTSYTLVQINSYLGGEAISKKLLKDHVELGKLTNMGEKEEARK